MEKPIKPNNIPNKAQWLAGVGAGSWFVIEIDLKKYRIKRFSPEGILECDRLFIVDKDDFDINIEYQFTYLSHCKECTIIQNNKNYRFFTNEY